MTFTKKLIGYSILIFQNLCKTLRVYRYGSCIIMLMVISHIGLHYRDGHASEYSKYNQEIEPPFNYEFAVKHEHPRLMLQRENLDDIKRWITSPAWNHWNMIYKLLTWSKDYAFVYALGQTEKTDEALKKAQIPSLSAVGRLAAGQLIQDMRKTYNFNFSNVYRKISKLDYFALRYDLAYHALTASERQQIVEYIVPKIRYEKFHFDWKAKWSGYREGSGNAPGIITGLAFYEHLSSAQERSFHRYVSDWLSDLRALNHRSGKSGGWGISLSYGIAHATSGAANLFALETATVDGGFIERFGNSFVHFGVAYAQLMLPSNSWARYGECIPSTLFTPLCKPPMPALRLGADYLLRQGATARASLSIWGQQNACGKRPEKKLKILDPIDILMYTDPEFRVDSLKDLGLPLAYAMGWDEKKGEIERYDGKKAGVGVIVMRSAWDDPMATHATFRSMPFMYPVHYNAGELTFSITKGEELALAYTGMYHPHYEGGPLNSDNPGWPHSGYYLKRSVSTNSLLVYDPKENFTGWNNDGGQRQWKGVPGIWWYGACRNGNPLDSGGLTGFEQNREYVWASADATRSYNSTLPMSCGPKNKPKVSLVQRDFVYLRSKNGWKDFFVIFDRVEAVDPDFKKIWLLHTQARPELDGSSVVSVGNEQAGILRSYNSSTVSVRQDQATLFSKTLLPKKGQFFIRYLGGQVKTNITKALTLEEVRKAATEPIDIEVASTDGLPAHPTVIVHHDPPEYEDRDTMDSFSTRPWSDFSPIKGKPPINTTRNLFFCKDKTIPGQSPAKLLNCMRPPKSNEPRNHNVGASVIQGFRFMGMEGTDKGDDSERLDYPHAYGNAYYQFKGFDGLLYGMWRVEVEVTKKEKFSNFLHVLYPSKQDGQMPPCNLIESKEGNAYGALIDNKLVIFSKMTAVRWGENQDELMRMKPLKEATYEIDYRGHLSQLVVNLEPNAAYTVIDGDTTVFDGAASNQGVIYFSTNHKGKSIFKLSLSQAQ